jgi:hypothetical protein
VSPWKNESPRYKDLANGREINGVGKCTYPFVSSGFQPTTMQVEIHINFLKFLLPPPPICVDATAKQEVNSYKESGNGMHVVAS